MSLTVNSIRWDGTGEPATERRNLEPAPKLLDEETIGNDGGKGQRAGLKKRRTMEKPDRDHPMFGDRMAGSSDEISSELPTRKQVRCSCWGQPKSRPKEVRASVVAGKRVMTVERRDVGK
jgi:hypothetical protein